MENKVLEKNIAQIEAYDINLANSLLTFSDEKSSVQLLQSENDEYNLLFQNQIIHSIQNPSLEAKNIVKKIENKQDKNAIRIIYGLGLGYLVDEMSAEIKDSPILIYEPNIEIIHFVLSIAQIDALFQKNVVLCQSKDVLLKHIQKVANEDTSLTITFLPSHKQTSFEDIKKTLEVAQRCIGEKIGNKNTLLRNAESSLVNTIFNLSQIIKNPDISQLKDIYKDKTALILCAGPSLEKNIETVIANKDKYVTFALNPTLKLLAEYDFKPDFVVSVETNDNTKQFENIDLSQSYLITEPFVFYTVPAFNYKKIFNYVSKDNFLNPWLRDIFDIKVEFQTHGTVSFTAFSAAIYMGFKKIILIGQDLAYSDGKCYTKGAQYQNLECVFDEKEQKYKIICTAKDFDEFVESNRADWMTFEFAKENIIKYIEKLNSSIYTVMSQENKPIATQNGYAIFIDIFANTARQIKEKMPHIELVNASVGGAQINGFENKSLQDAILKDENIEKINIENYENAYDKQKIKNAILKMKKDIEEFYEVIKTFNKVNLELSKELEIKKIYTSNAQRLYEKHRQQLSKLQSFAKVENFEMVMYAYVAPLIPLVSGDYSNDALATKKIIIEINKTMQRALKHLPMCIDKLANC